MGLYTGTSRYESSYDYASEIPMNEAYANPFGYAQALVDVQMNDMALFEGALMDDIDEVSSYNEGYEVVNEGTFVDILGKIKELFKKLIAKIKGIFSSFLTKLTAAFKNGQELVKKYKKDIVGYSNWKGFNLKKVRKPKFDIFTLEQAKAYKKKVSASGYSDMEKAAEDIYKIKYNTITNRDPGFENWIENVGGHNSMENVKGHGIFEKDLDASDLKDKLLKLEDYKDISWDSFDDDWKEYSWEDEEDFDGEDDIKSGTFFTSNEWIVDCLEGGSKMLEGVKKSNSKTEKHINHIIENINNYEKALKDNMATFTGKQLGYQTNGVYSGTKGVVDLSQNKKLSSSEFKANSFDKSSVKSGKTGNPAGLHRSGYYAQQFLVQRLQTIASNHQTVIIRVNQAWLKNYKDALAQARAIWVKAAAWTKRTHKEESTEYFDAVYDITLNETYSNFDSLS